MLTAWGFSNLHIAFYGGMVVGRLRRRFLFLAGKIHFFGYFFEL